MAHVLQGPILAVTFGIVIRDRTLQKLGVQNELIALGLCIVIGFISGIIHGSLYEYSSNDFWLINEMVARLVGYSSIQPTQNLSHPP